MAAAGRWTLHAVAAGEQHANTTADRASLPSRAIPRGAVERGAKRIRVHVLTDGRDVPDGSSITFVQQLEEDLAALRDK